MRMDRLYGMFLIVILAGLLVSGCSRNRSADEGRPDTASVSAAERAEIAELQSETTPPPPPQEPRRSSSSEERSRARTVSAAFFAVDDTGFSIRSPEVFDYEIGRLERRIPEGLAYCLVLLGSDLPVEYLAPEWRAHLNRQSEQFERQPVGFRVSADDGEGALNTRFKALWNDSMVIGFVRARNGEDGRYLLEDLGIEKRLEKPYPNMEIPPPLADTVY